LIDEDAKEFKNFIDVIVSISGNRDLKNIDKNYYAKRKLIKTTGESDGK
jgi:hypothetical protein